MVAQTFVIWTVDNGFTDKDLSHQTFYKVLQTINDDQKASSELHDFTQKLLNSKKVSCNEDGAFLTLVGFILIKGYVHCKYSWVRPGRCLGTFSAPVLLTLY